MLALLLGGTAFGQVTQRVSITSTGLPGSAGSNSPVMSSDGRYVTFHSPATNLVPGDTNAVHDVFVRDRVGGTTERASVTTGGTQGNAASNYPVVSADGRYVAWSSPSSNLVAGDTNGCDDVFVRDRQLGTTERVSVATGGAQGMLDSLRPAISTDGRYVAFESRATNFDAADTNGVADIFVRDRLLATTERVSISTAGAEGTFDSLLPAISSNGRYVAFYGLSPTLVVGDTSGQDVFVRDRLTGTTERVSVATGGTQGNGNSYEPAISADGRYVAFRSDSSYLVIDDTNGFMDVFVRDRQDGTTVRASLTNGGAQATGSCENPSISADGRYVGFESIASNLVAGDTNAVYDVFLRDLVNGTTDRVSVGAAGVQGSSSSFYSSLSSDARYIAFYSLATNLVPGDVNGGADVFVRDRQGAPDFTSVCDAGVGGVIPCPCGNPPSGPGQGCDNSLGTGGAVLSASGGSYLSSDSLVFTSVGERPTSLSIVAQWIGFNPTGVVFGMGVRCTSGTFKRLYSKVASGGSITAPNFTSGDLPVSARSAALGDSISAGQSRWYLVYYRDPFVIGGCPATSTFNATQTGQVTWSP